MKGIVKMRYVNFIVFLLFALVVIALTVEAKPDSLNRFERFNRTFTKAEMVAIGERVYNVEGTTTCVACHGPQGQGGYVSSAPKLNDSTKFEVYDALGGKKAFKKDPAKFKRELETVHVYLLRMGSVNWNKFNKQAHPEVQLDWSKTNRPHGKLDPNMFGVTKIPTLYAVHDIREELNKNRNLKLSHGDMEDLAAYSVYQYMKTLDTEGIWK